MASVLVTGGAGYVGSHACKALALAGYTPVTFDNLSEGHRWAVRWGPFVHGDLMDRAAIRRAIDSHKVEAVLHFAASAQVGISMVDPGSFFRNNVVGSLNLLEAMAETGVRDIVFSSTCATYGQPEQATLSEDHPQRPINPYGESKLVVEKMLRWFGAVHQFRWLALRYFNAAGADPDGELGEDHDPETHLIPLTIFAALKQRPAINLFGTDYPTPDGTALRDYIHVADLASAHVAGLRHLQANGESCALNLGTGVGHSVREVISAVEQVAGRAITVVEGPRRAGDPPILVADPRLSRERLAWVPQLSDIGGIVETAWRWHNRRPNV